MDRTNGKADTPLTQVGLRSVPARWKFEVTENGHWVAGGECSDQGRAMAEAAHYTRVYGQDGGDVRALVWTGRKPRNVPGPQEESE